LGKYRCACLHLGLFLNPAILNPHFPTNQKNMKRICFILMVLAFNLPAVSGFAQNVAINEDGAMANPNAILDVKSGNKGVLIPRMSTAGRLAIPTTKGLLVYDTTVGSFFFNNGSAWQNNSREPS